MIVLGVDVGIQTCGYVICAVKNLDIALIKEGEIKPPHKLCLHQKLAYIFDELKKEVGLHKPEVIVVEKLYSHYRHPVTLGVLSHVRGVVALLACQSGVEFLEYSPTRARKSFMGRGSVDSERVKKMAENMTGADFKSCHTADAFSLVAAFSHEDKVRRIFFSARGKVS